jgi:hypothetical protein
VSENGILKAQGQHEGPLAALWPCLSYTMFDNQFPLTLPRSAFFVNVISVVDEDLLPLRDGLDASDATAVAESWMLDETEFGVALLLQRVVHLVTESGAVAYNAVIKLGQVRIGYDAVIRLV